MSTEQQTPEEIYEAEAGEALRAFQSDEIPFPEWNRRQGAACAKYREAIAKARGQA